MNKINLLKIILSGMFFVFCFDLAGAAPADYLTCGGDKTEGDCVAAGGTVVDAGGCTACKINGSSCPSEMTKYGNWGDFTSQKCGRDIERVCMPDGNCYSNPSLCVDDIKSCTTEGGWLSDKPMCYYDMVGDKLYKINNISCSSTCYTYCGAGVHNYLIFDCNAYYTGPATGYCGYWGRGVYECYALQTSLACIGSGVTPITLKFWADPTGPLDYNTQTLLKWTSANATACNSSGDWNPQPRALNNTTGFNTGSLNSDRTYTLTCSNSITGKSVTEYVTVDVNPCARNCPNPESHCADTLYQNDDGCGFPCFGTGTCCDSKCSPAHRATVCKGTTINDGCAPGKICEGTKDCSWQEVAP